MIMRTLFGLSLVAFGLGTAACAVGVGNVDESLLGDDGGLPNDEGGVHDAGRRDSGRYDAGVREASSDSALGPSAAVCLEGWAGYAGTCPAPQITSSYVASGCVGTTGWFVVGSNFQVEQRNTGTADDGPQSIGANGDQKMWNVITTTQLCVTISAAAKAAWVGHTVYVKNPDGKTSNAVIVTDLL